MHAVIVVTSLIVILPQGLLPHQQKHLSGPRTGKSPFSLNILSRKNQVIERRSNYALFLMLEITCQCDKFNDIGNLDLSGRLEDGKRVMSIVQNPRNVSENSLDPYLTWVHPRVLESGRCGNSPLGILYSKLKLIFTFFDSRQSRLWRDSRYCVIDRTSTRLILCLYSGCAQYRPYIRAIMLADTISTRWLALPTVPMLLSLHRRTHVVEKKDVLPQLSVERTALCLWSLL
uniref:Uncharacterized protein n=1 Tax=Timema douglasi TaxID=61478 RepID=A0A7R8VW55_TIMDO|nr:unnamed protein product [Timema douglasi]